MTVSGGQRLTDKNIGKRQRLLAFGSRKAPIYQVHYKYHTKFKPFRAVDRHNTHYVRTGLGICGQVACIAGLKFQLNALQKMFSCWFWIVCGKTLHPFPKMIQNARDGDFSFLGRVGEKMLEIIGLVQEGKDNRADRLATRALGMALGEAKHRGNRGK